MYTQLVDQMSKETEDSVPIAYRENQLRWSNLMMKSPQI